MKQLSNYWTLLRWKAFIDIDEITTINRCTRDITGHLQVLHLKGVRVLKSEADLILLRAGKFKNYMI